MEYASLLIVTHFPPFLHAQSVAVDTTAITRASRMTGWEFWLAILNLAVLFATALIVALYTKYTNDLRKAAQKQTAEAQKQTEAVQEQVKQMEKNYQQLVRQLNFEVEKANWHVRPKLSMHSWNARQPSIWNKGGDIRDIELEAEGDFKISLERSEIFRNGQRTQLMIDCGDEQLEEGVRFVMRFTNELDKRREIRYCIKRPRIFEAPRAEKVTAQD